MTIRMPRGLRESEKEHWRHVVGEFGADNLDPSDTSLVLGLALQRARLDDIRRLLQVQQRAETARGDARRELPYLLERTARGVTANPLIGHERDTIKEIRLMHDQIKKSIAERSPSAGAGPAPLSEMRRRLSSSA